MLVNIPYMVKYGEKCPLSCWIADRGAFFFYMSTLTGLALMESVKDVKNGYQPPYEGVLNGEHHSSIQIRNV